MKLRELLRELPAGLPSDTLLARIKGRRSFLVPDWERHLLAPLPLATLPPAPWRTGGQGGGDWPRPALQQEYYWVFARMDEGLRCASAPFFWLAEIRTLAIALRRLQRNEGVEPLFAASLLAPPVRSLLCRPGDNAARVERLATLLAGIDPAFRSVSPGAGAVDFGALENALTEITLQHLSHTRLVPPLRRYVTLLIDSRNLTTVAKQLRWRLITLPPLLAGGSIPRERLADLSSRREYPPLLQLAMRLGGGAHTRSESDLEKLLYESQDRLLRRLARAGDGIGAILYYLWRCGQEAVNLALLQRLERIGSTAVHRELRR